MIGGIIMILGMMMEGMKMEIPPPQGSDTEGVHQALRKQVEIDLAQRTVQ